ncbi:MAG: hypothetical protein Q6L68_05305 [Thermostichus sp. DG02_5_bins_236]
MVEFSKQELMALKRIHPRPPLTCHLVHTQKAFAEAPLHVLDVGARDGHEWT